MSSSVLLVGGGLANCLIALRLRATLPDVQLTIVEAADQLCGNHTWSFHGSDVSPAILDWLRPLANYAWPHYDVRFPDRIRRLDGAYHSLTSEHLRDVVMGTLSECVRLNASVVELNTNGVMLEGGERLAADLVVDGRGLNQANSSGLTLRFQKFLGQVWRLRAPHELTGPLLMDATVAQDQGYRFVYLLPLGQRELLIEDTYYSDAADLDREVLRENIARYVADQNWEIEARLREETGILPIVLDCNLATFWPPTDPVPRAGLRAGLFHHTTGYSVPEAAALADALPRQPTLQSSAIAPWIRARVHHRWRSQRIFRLLNRMLFLAAAPAERYRVLQHFYRLPEAVIERFYAGHLSAGDAGRVLSGTPPIPVHRALRYLLPSSSHS